MERSEGLNWWYISPSKAIEDKDQESEKCSSGVTAKAKMPWVSSG